MLRVLRCLHFSHLQLFLGEWSSGVFAIVESTSLTSLTWCFFLRHFAVFVLYSFLAEGAERAWYHMGSCPWTFSVGFVATNCMLHSSTSFNIALRSSGRVDPFFLVFQLWMIGMTRDSGESSTLWEGGMSVAISASAKYVQVALSSPKFR